MTLALTNAGVRSNWMLRRLFALAARGCRWRASASAPTAPAPTKATPMPEQDREPGARAAPLLREFRIVTRISSKPTSPTRERGSDARDASWCPHATAGRARGTPLDRAIHEARNALIAAQDSRGFWLFELEADCTIPAEYIMMMHFLDEIDTRCRRRSRLSALAAGSDGGWPFYQGGEMDISGTVKAYYALKLAGDSPNAPHMQKARASRYCSAAARRRPMCSRALRSRSSSSCRGGRFPTCPWKSCCCRAGLRCIWTRWPIGRAP
jgi:hypothetical protein